MGINPMI